MLPLNEGHTAQMSATCSRGTPNLGYKGPPSRLACLGDRGFRPSGRLSVQRALGAERLSSMPFSSDAIEIQPAVNVPLGK